jgi:protein TonB
MLSVAPAASAPAPEARPIAVAEPAPHPPNGPTIASPPVAVAPTPAEPVARVASAPAAPERRGKPSTLWLAEYERQVARVKSYPQIARIRGWEGTTVVMVQLAPDGTILDARVAESSGHEVLDRQAISMVRRAEPAPPWPAAGSGGSNGPFEVRLPIVFALASRD